MVHEPERLHQVCLRDFDTSPIYFSEYSGYLLILLIQRQSSQWRNSGKSNGDIQSLLGMFAKCPEQRPKVSSHANPIDILVSFSQTMDLLATMLLDFDVLITVMSQLEQQRDVSRLMRTAQTLHAACIPIR